MKYMKKKYIYALAQSFCLFILFCAVCAIASFNMRYNVFEKYVFGFWTDVVYDRVGFFYSLAVFFSLASVFCINHLEYKRQYLAEEKGRLRFILTSPLFWIEIAVFFVCSLLCPIISPFSELINGFFYGISSIAVKKILSFVIYLPLFTLLTFLAHLSTVSWWAEQRGKRPRPKKLPAVISFVIQVAYTSFLWAFGGYALAVIFPAFLSLGLVVKILVLPLVLFAVLAVVVIVMRRYWLTVCLRRKFIARLKRICKEKGYSVSVNSIPYRSNGLLDRQCDLIVKTDKEQLACGFICAMSKLAPIYLHENGVLTYEKNMLFFKHEVEENYSFEAESGTRKFLIICPCRGRAFIKSPTENKLVDVGDKLMEYRVYNSSGFINAVERDCI